MKTIHKYVLTGKREEAILMPENATILSVSDQGRDICIWAEVETDNSLSPRNI